MAATAVADASGSSSEVLGGWDFASLAEAVQPSNRATQSTETPKRHRGTGRPRTSVWRAYALFRPVGTATPPLCVVGYRWLCIQRLVRYRPIATR